MNILLINLIMTTAEKGVITRRESIADTMICNFARGFVAQGHRVTIAAAADFRPTLQEDLGFEVIYFKSRMPRVFKPHLLPWPQGFKGWLRENEKDFDMIVSSEAFSMGTLAAALVCPDKLIIWQEMSRHQRLAFELPSRLWYNVVTRIFMRKCLVVPRSTTAAAFVSVYNSHVSKRLVDHGANGQLLFPGDEVGDNFIVLAQLIPRKRIDTIINHFAALVSKPEYAHYLLHIVGDGVAEDALKQQVAEANLEEKVIFHGFMRHREVAPLLRNSRALLVNTAMDLNMVTIPESIISGTPVISNTLPNTAQFIAERHLGIARDNWDENDMIEIIKNYDTYHRACIEVRESLTNEGCARLMVDIYTDWRKDPNNFQVYKSDE